MQATVSAFDPATSSGTVLLDDGVELEFSRQALAGTGLRLLRPGQRVRLRTSGHGAELTVAVTQRGLRVHLAVDELHDVPAELAQPLDGAQRLLVVDLEEPLAAAPVPLVVAHRGALSQVDAEPREPADDVVGSPGGLLDELHRGEALEERPERRLQLDPSQRRAEAEVDPRAERQVRVG